MSNIHYSGNTSGDMAVAKNMPITTVNSAVGNVAVDYPAGASMGPVVKPVMSKMLGNTTGTVQSTVTGNTGNR